MQIIFLVTYLVVQLIEYFLQYLNLYHIRKYGDQVPPEFEGVIDVNALVKTRNYTVDNMKLDFLSDGISIALQLVFIFGGWLSIYNSWILSLSSSFIIQGLLFFAILGAIKFLISIPFDIYETFYLEEKYGFNTKTISLWITDSIKSIIISLILFGLIGSAAFWIIQHNQTTWWIWTWLFFMIISLFMMYISPYVLEPLFNKFTPLDDDDELSTRLRALMANAGLSISRVFKIDASRRSKHSNAYFTGIGRVKRIVLYDTLLDLMSHNEILAVLAHEAGHWKKKHILKHIVVAQILGLVSIFIGYQILASGLLIGYFQIIQSSFFANLYLLFFLSSIISFLQTPLMSIWSRKHEWEADRFATRLIGNSHDLATALQKLSKDNLSNLHPHPWFAKIYYSHPPVIERLKKLL
ncbi:M48 family metallopeptidase [candidate division KSB1 bacterium]|nr:M48 family metallopeptidase [candidate division KSB1 bacterium]